MLDTTSDIPRKQRVRRTSAGAYGAEGYSAGQAIGENSMDSFLGGQLRSSSKRRKITPPVQTEPILIEDDDSEASPTKSQERGGAHQMTKRNTRASKRVKAPNKELFVYPAGVAKGGIKISTMDTDCLEEGTVLSFFNRNMYVRGMMEEFTHCFWFQSWFESNLIQRHSSWASRLRLFHVTFVSIISIANNGGGEGEGTALSLIISSFLLRLDTAGEFLNDVIINFYLKRMEIELPEAMRKRVHFFNTFFYKKLTQNGIKKDELEKTYNTYMKRWTKTVDIFEKDFIIVPVNQSAHWFLFIICFPGLRKAWCSFLNRICTALDPHDYFWVEARQCQSTSLTVAAIHYVTKLKAEYDAVCTELNEATVDMDDISVVGDFDDDILCITDASASASAEVSAKASAEASAEASADDSTDVEEAEAQSDLGPYDTLLMNPDEVLPDLHEEEVAAKVEIMAMKEAKPAPTADTSIVQDDISEEGANDRDAGNGDNGEDDDDVDDSLVTVKSNSVVKRRSTPASDEDDDIVDTTPNKQEPSSRGASSDFRTKRKQSPSESFSPIAKETAAPAAKKSKGKSRATPKSKPKPAAPELFASKRACILSFDSLGGRRSAQLNVLATYLKLAFKNKYDVHPTFSPATC
jgi:hypothetical protein